MFLIAGVVIVGVMIWLCNVISEHAGPFEGILARLLTPIFVPIIFVGLGAILLGLLGF